MVAELGGPDFGAREVTKSTGAKVKMHDLLRHSVQAAEKKGVIDRTGKDFDAGGIPVLDQQLSRG
jgi:hypothetical protein